MSEATEGEYVEQTIEEVEEEEARPPRVPHDPGRPTRKELAEHLCIHWPFRSWCRHCVCGRAVASPHRSRTEEDREFGRGRIPTISLDHCFLGSKDSEDESAHRNPFLVCYDNETEGIFTVAVASKSTKPWIVEWLKNVLYEFGYGQMKVAIKCDGARELQELRRAVGNSRESPTVPIDVPVRESKANGGMERAVRTWAGQFRTLKSHLEYEAKVQIPLHHPVLQWMAWWSAGIYNRFAVRHHGRTAHEYASGHKTKLPVACFGETVLWRKKRTIAELNKHDVEYSEGVFLGMSGMGSELVVGTPEGVFRTRDMRILSDHDARWNSEFLLKFNTSFEQYVDPAQSTPDYIAIEPGVIAHDVLPQDVEIPVGTRRMRLSPSDFVVHGYTAGCPGCIALRRKAGQSRNHTEQCRLRMENCLKETAEGRSRKEREAARREDELTAALAAEDAKIQAEKSNREARSQGEQAETAPVAGMPIDGEHVDDPAEDTAEHFMMTPDRASGTAQSQGSPAISDESFATDDVPMNTLNRELFTPMDAASPASSRGAKRSKLIPTSDIYIC